MRRRPQLPGTLGEQAYTRIRDKILRGDLPIGAAISRRQLAAEFGMSFLPITEAVQRLEADGLVESRARVGTRVRIPTARDLRERCILREALEVQSARLFAEKASADERSELCAMAARLDALIEEAAGNHRGPEFLFRMHTYHLTFHMRIAECTGCGLLCEALDKNQLLIFNWLYDTAAHHRMPPHHRQLMESVAGSDPDTAETAMRAHIRYGMEEIYAEIAARFSSGSTSFPELTPKHSWRIKAASSQPG